MNITAFFVDALGTALEVGVATPDDVLRHVTPDVLAAHVPRPLWSKLMAACLAASRTDAKLVVDTVGVPALCEHTPGTILWACVSEVGQRALGKSIIATPPAVASASGSAPSSSAGPSSVAASTPAAASAGSAASAPSAAGASAVPTAVATEPSAPVALPSSRPFGGSARIQTPATGVPIPSRQTGSGAVAIPPASASGTGTGTATGTSGGGASAAADEPAPLGAPPAAAPPTASSSSTMRLPGMARPATEPSRPSTPSIASAGNGVRTTGAGASSRRPQAQASGPTTPAPASTRPGSRTSPPPVRRATTGGADFDIDTDISSEWKKGGDAPAVDVDEEQLVDWAQAEETSAGTPDQRKR